jgi:hypothetical protein
VTEIHEDTLKALKGSLAGMEKLSTLLDIAPVEDDVRLACGELRGNFPGLDDLTLAAFCTYVASVEFESAKEYRNIEALGGAAAYAAMALELAKSIREPA